MSASAVGRLRARDQRALDARRRIDADEDDDLLPAKVARVVLAELIARALGPAQDAAAQLS